MNMEDTSSLSIRTLKITRDQFVGWDSMAHLATNPYDYYDVDLALALVINGFELNRRIRFQSHDGYYTLYQYESIDFAEEKQIQCLKPKRNFT